MRDNFLIGKDKKNSILKKTILRLCIASGEQSIAEISERIHASVPTATKLIQELIDEGFMIAMGKSGTSGGRRPSIYGLNPSAGYLVGVDVGYRQARLVVTDFKGSVIKNSGTIPFVMEANEESVRVICSALRGFFERNGLDWDRVLGCGLSFSGRVNPRTGYSNSFSYDKDYPLDKSFEDYLGVPVNIDNDSRAMTYGEYIGGVVKKEKNVLFVNVSWGLGMGMILDGKLYFGKSGYSGEFGHFPLLDNDVICRCGKVGCLETGASGSALYRRVLEELAAGKASSLSAKFRRGDKITLEDILVAINEEDVLAIRIVEEIGSTLGRGIAGLINVFNPEVVVIGGRLAVGGDYLMLPIKSTVKKLSQNFVSQDTSIKFSRLGADAAPFGDCMLSRSKLLGVVSY